MALEEILKRIEEETEEKIKEIDSRAAEETAKITADGRERTEKARKAKAKDSAAAAEDVKQRKLASRRIELKNTLLEAKHDLLQKAFDEAFERVLALPDAQYKSLIKKLMLDHAEPGRGRVLISARDKDRISGKLISEAVNELKKQGEEYEYELADEPAGIQGGFIIEMEKITINCSLDAMFLKAREELTGQVGEVLFKHG